jgi:hypothetical protein
MKKQIFEDLRIERKRKDINGHVIMKQNANKDFQKFPFVMHQGLNYF